MAPSPDQLSAALDQARRLAQGGRLADAAQACRRAIAIAPRDAEAHHLLGLTLIQAGQVGPAVASFRQAATIAPAAPGILNHLGVALCQDGAAAEGVEVLRRAVALAPKAADIACNLGRALDLCDRRAEAAEFYATATAAAPTLWAAWAGLMSVLHRLGDLERALAIAHRAVAACPRTGAAHANLGRLLMETGDARAAEAALRQALAIDARLGDAANNLGTLAEEAGRASEALALYRTATRTRPDLADGWSNLGNALERVGQLEDARAPLMRACDLAPANGRARAALISLRRKLCDWDGLDGEVRRLGDLIRAGGGEAPAPFATLSLDLSPEEQLLAARAHGRAIVGKVARWSGRIPPLAPRIPAAPGARLRIGYLSPDFRDHPIAHLMAGVLERHDRDRVEVTAWSLGPDDGSRFRHRIAGACDGFVDLAGLPTEDAVRRIRAAGQDILVDLAGYTAHARPEILALRAAPIQVNYLGMPGTMGAPFMDAIVADATVLPPEDERWYDERVWRLPHCYQANDDRAEIDPAPWTRAEAGLPARGVVFCCFSMNYKIDPPLMDAWAAILAAVPGSVLWLFRTDEPAARNLRAEAARRGLAPERLVFADRVPKARHLARHRLADLFLDSFAYGAHTTASDALWVGLPVLTLAGNSFARRVGASLVKAAGLPELATTSVGQYVGQAIALAQDPGRLHELCARLSAQRGTCPLFDTRAIAAGLEDLYAAMAAVPVAAPGTAPTGGSATI
jgi:predicted O-linked N-acetylglucosamine transferase (SPINDLY family)